MWSEQQQEQQKSATTTANISANSKDKIHKWSHAMCLTDLQPHTAIETIF